MPPKIHLPGLIVAVLLVLHATALRAADTIRPLSVAAGQSSGAGFTLMAPSQTGIGFANTLPESRFKTNQILLNGSGVAAGDVDGDGKCDLYFARLNGSNVLYRNLGNWRFEDVTTAAGVACGNLDSTGVAFADLDGDGDLDLIVNTIGNGTHLFSNNGRGQFVSLAGRTPLNGRHGGMSMALGDADGDGFLDLYVANYRTLALMDMPGTRFNFARVNGQQVISTVNGRPVSDPEFANRFTVTERGGIEELGEADTFYRNVGGTNFQHVPFVGGAFLDEERRPLAAPPHDWGLSVMFRDINGDLKPDLYVCNDFDSPDRIWLNVTGGTNEVRPPDSTIQRFNDSTRPAFRAAPPLMLRKLSQFSMGADFADINRDGFDDLFVLDMLSRSHVQRMTALPDRTLPAPVVGQINDRPQYQRNTLFLNRGDGTYAEIGAMAGVDAAEWAWGTLFLDVDLDGWEDILITNGHERDGRNMDKAEDLRVMRAQGKLKTNEETFNARGIFPRLATANLAFRNNRDLTFTDKSSDWRFDQAGVSHGIALADLDGDGDQDVIVNNLNAPASLLRNEATAPRVAVRLKGMTPNTAGIGAQIKVLGGPVAQQQEMISGGRYLSSDDAMRVFAVGSPTNTVSVEVTWRSGKRSRFDRVPANSIVELAEPATPIAPHQESAASLNHVTNAVAFSDVSALLNHTHTETLFDDFARQPLLPQKLSQLGPGVAWHDVTGDGWDDAIVTSGQGGALAVFQNNEGRSFARMSNGFLALPAASDQTAVLAWPKGTGHVALVVGLASWEAGNTNDSVAAEYDFKSKMMVSRLPGSASSIGPMALADVDSDRDLDLFLGGRAVPGQFPAPASSMLLRNAGARFELDAENTKALHAVGLVSGATFSDLNQDGAPDLVLACEWGPVRVFMNHGGKLTDATASLGLDRFKGLWNGVATGDLDGDGRLDIVAANAGRNTKYELYQKPLRLFYGDLSGDGSIQIVEAYDDPVLAKTVPIRQRDILAKSMPAIRARFPAHEAYARAGVESIIADGLPEAKRLEASWLDTTVFFNRGTNFTAAPLPKLAQAAPAFGVCVADFNGDGAEDLFLAQNSFSVHPETPRLDGGIGLVLVGDARGGFAPLGPRESGIRIYGEQRGAAVADFDGDGKPDLLVGQSGQQTKLFRNTNGRAGLRVKLAGSAANPDGIGASLQLGDGTRVGPLREVQSGSGYWSQNSPVQVMTFNGSATTLRIRWPGGKQMDVAMPSGARDLTVDITGKVSAK